MDSSSIQLVQNSWQKVAAIGPQAAALFYANLFDADPALKPLFKGDLHAQGKKLIDVKNPGAGAWARFYGRCKNGLGNCLWGYGRCYESGGKTVNTALPCAIRLGNLAIKLAQGKACSFINQRK